ncbi:MAG: hypothetical protein GX337_04865 [Christensenellaceae bacterium]|nr:hypothetical protein [Christensenellaceae bacterium]
MTGTTLPKAFPALKLNPVPEMRDEVVEKADKHINHFVNLLGTGWVQIYYDMPAKGFMGHNYREENVSLENTLNDMSDEHKKQAVRLLDLAHKYVQNYKPIDWRIEVKSGYRYPMLHFTQLNYGVIEGVDAKITYDISRLAHMVTLGQAWQLTGDMRYRNEIIAQLLDWIAMNPCEYGIGWHANMNVAIRMMNAAIACSYIRESLDPIKDGEFISVFLKSMAEHRKFMAENLEFSESSIHPNHYFGDLAGFHLCTLLLEEDIADARAWLRLIQREYHMTIDSQFGDDGMQCEGATNYHAFTLEMLVEGLMLCANQLGCRKAQDYYNWILNYIGKKRMEKLKLMFMGVKGLLQPNGIMPIIGDNDSGRMLELSEPGISFHDWQYLLCIGAMLFDDYSLLKNNTDFVHWYPARAWFEDAAPKENNLPEKSEAYNDVGYYILKSDEVYALIICGPIGTWGLGGHTHDDRLSFVLNLCGLPFLVDPGNYAYTASLSLRDKTRSAIEHNTLVLANEPHNRKSPDSIWWGSLEETKCKCTKWDVDGKTLVFEGVQHAYKRLPQKITHIRRLEIDTANRKGLLTDMLEQEVEGALPKANWTFNIHPDCGVLLSSPSKAVIKNDSVTMTLETKQGEWRLEDSLYYPAYGEKIDTKRLRLSLYEGLHVSNFSFTWENQ